ncbi:MAG: hypothetical protein INR71_00020 [Terriglobus roseus]|nr:hypothetical protein [Terriglobus roseus]
MGEATVEVEVEAENGDLEISDWRADPGEARRLIATSGLFDPDWYIERHGLSLTTDLDALDHYLTSGVQGILAPGPLFDPKAYLDVVWFLRPGHDDPLEHFLRHGQVERRFAKPAVVAKADFLDRPFEPLCSRFGDGTRFRIVVVVHAFHADAFVECCDLFRHLPDGCLFLVSTDDEQKATAFREAFADLATCHSIIVKITPNRGRNFGPVLVEFRQQILCHDIILHVHTKRTDYGSIEQRGWRSALLRTLLPSKPTVSWLLDRFEHDTQLGVLTAAVGPAVRYWAYNWLSNRSLVQSVLSRLQMNVAISDGMLDYPIGGMFWARTTALRPLLNHSWAWEDFPEETGQKDGTIAHVIERIIIMIARQQGFHFGEIDCGAAIIRSGWSSRGLDQYDAVDEGALLDTIIRHDVISFNIDGTLFSKKSSVSEHISNYIGSLLIENLQENSADSKSTLHFGMEDTRVNELRPRRTMWNAVRHAAEAGRRIVLTAGSYLSRTDADRLLDQAHLRDLVDELYLPAQRLVGKKDSNILKLMRSRECLKKHDGQATSVVHIGDDPQADIQQSADIGMEHFHVFQAAEIMSSKGLVIWDERPDGSRGMAQHILLQPVADHLFEDPFEVSRFGKHLISKPEDLGFAVLGPMIFAFMAFVVRNQPRGGGGPAFFVSREGWFLGRLYSVISRAAGLRDLPRAQYLLCSRRWVLSAMQGSGVKVGPLLEGAGYSGTVRDFLEARTGSRFAEGKGPFDQDVRLPGGEGVVRYGLALGEDRIQQEGASRLIELRSYAQLCGPTESALCTFVDIGYSATVQDALQRLLGARLAGLYMGTSHAASRVYQTGGVALGCFASGDAELSGFTGTFGLMLEAVLTAPHGQAVGYSLLTGPIFRDGGISQSSTEILERIYRGMETYALGLIHRWGAGVLQVPFDAGVSTSMMQAVKDGRLLLAPDLTRALSVEDDFCGSGEIPVFDRAKVRSSAT